MPRKKATAEELYLLRTRSLRLTQEDREKFAIKRKERDIVADRREIICKTCDEFNGNICEEKYPKGRCYGGWRTFLREGICPNGLF